MPRVYAFAGLRPVVDPSTFVHPDAVLVGDVVIGAGCWVGPLASLRGDMGRIEVRAGANVQDGCVLHCFPGRDCIVEEDGHIGIGAVLHGCRVGRGALVGMQAVVMDNAVIGEAAIIAAMAFVKAGMVVPPAHLAAGLPARVIRPLRADELAWKRDGTAEYHALVARCRDTLIACEPLPAVEPGRPRLGGATGIRPKVEGSAPRIGHGERDVDKLAK